MAWMRVGPEADAAPVLLAGPLEEAVGDEQDVLAALAQRRQVDGHHGEPVVEVLAEEALLRDGS